MLKHIFLVILAWGTAFFLFVFAGIWAVAGSRDSFLFIAMGVFFAMWLISRLLMRSRATRPWEVVLVVFPCNSLIKDWRFYGDPPTLSWLAPLVIAGVMLLISIRLNRNRYPRTG